MANFRTIRTTSFALLATSLLLAGCSGDASKTAEAGGKTVETSNETTMAINAKGSSFVKPFMENVLEAYKGKSGTSINYQGGGSGAGISALIDGTVPFACSDAPMSDEEMTEAETKLGSKAMNLPIVLGAISIAYNAPGVTDLKMDGETLAGVFMRSITKWNDPKIAALNPGTTLPDADIRVIVRGDGSGSTYVLSDYLSAVSTEWKEKMGRSKKLNWPQGVTAMQQSDGVTKATKDTPGSITYTEVSYALQSGLGMAMVKNASGEFVKPEGAAVTAAAAGASLPDDFRGSIVNSPGKGAYPISSFVFALLPTDMSKNPSGQAIVDAMNYILTEGQMKAGELHYAPVPESVATKVIEQLKSIKVK
ncbi:MAG: phosphate ABC transporter substrate-binding protein PstS [Chthonomonas sp.]|nr:phosphate ABC transporter substrate-binding protein PstS [Chthonomonas sp.]